MSLSICSLLLSKERQKLAQALWEMVDPSSEFGNPFMDTVATLSPQEAEQKKPELVEWALIPYLGR